jgi:hypothetical protein
MRIRAPATGIVAGDIFSDRSILSLLFVNLVTIVMAVVDHWDLGTVLFIYWFQSVIIGVFTVAAILNADSGDFGRAIQDKLPSEGNFRANAGKYFGYGKVFLAGFFALHYGLFHWGYYIFLSDFGLFSHLDLLNNPGIPASCGLFFANHLYSYLYHRTMDRGVGASIEELFTQPYLRIIPMHLTIMFGGIALFTLSGLGIDATQVVLVFFLCLKTYVDVKMHTAKHRQGRADYPGAFG